jgi:hypothetical protein
MLFLARVLLLLYLVVPASARAGTEVRVLDGLALKGSPYMISVTTGGIVLPKGGELVEFFVNDRSIGRNLSGGDGRAFREYTPHERGLHVISAVSGGQKGRGMLLALEKGESIVFIDIEGGLPEGIFPMKPGDGAQAAIELISERFPIVYLQTLVPDKSLLSAWLGKHGFQDAPILRWDGGDIFDDVTGYGLKVRAVIGSPAVIESAAGYTESLFSIREADGAEKIGDWKDLGGKIR